MNLKNESEQTLSALTTFFTKHGYFVDSRKKRIISLRFSNFYVMILNRRLFVSNEQLPLCSFFLFHLFLSVRSSSLLLPSLVVCAKPQKMQSIWAAQWANRSLQTVALPFLVTLLRSSYLLFTNVMEITNSLGGETPC